MKKAIHLILILLGLTLVLSAVSQIPTFSAEKKGNETKGRYYFRQTCKNCHTKGAAGGEITPLSKTQAQWHDYFVKSKHNKGSEPLSKVMGEEEVQHVSVYLVAHAADSLQPETCGK
jgi:mono/diheme cytochrome c family protein